jgi:hypothetical protein
MEGAVKVSSMKGSAGAAGAPIAAMGAKQAMTMVRNDCGLRIKGQTAPGAHLLLPFNPQSAIRNPQSFLIR